MFELGLRRIREELGLEPVEFPTTRKMGASPPARAEDIHAALSDPEITVLMASIGGDDQITVLPHLDPDLVRTHPKPFFGYSDNTNFLTYLWQLGIVSYHGGSVLVHLGRGRLHPYSIGSLRRALFESGEVELIPPGEHTDESIDWSTPEALTSAAPIRPNDGWRWRNADQVIEGVTFGGCLEILDWQLAVRRWLAPFEAYDGAVLLIETSEEMPSSDQVYRILRNFGEAGLLQRFAAVLVGRPKAWNISRRTTLEERREYAAAQANAICRALDEYHPGC